MTLTSRENAEQAEVPALQRAWKRRVFCTLMISRVVAAALLLGGVRAQLTEQWATLELCYVDAGWECVVPEQRCFARSPAQP